MENFADRLLHEIDDKGAPICVGLDSYFEKLPAQVATKAVKEHGPTAAAAAAAILEFNKAVIDAIAPDVPVVKLQNACYERHGANGVQAFEDTIGYAKSKGLLVISDAKRSDISSSAEGYADAHLGRTAVGGKELPGFDADAVTLNPYMGADSVKPFLERCSRYGKGAFVLVKTSNPSSGEIQNLETSDGMNVYEKAALLAGKWAEGLRGKNGFSALGIVAGATYPEEMARLRELLPGVFFLVPGYGAQGAAAEGVRNAFTAHKTGAIVNSSRGIIFAFAKEPYKSKFGENKFAEAARAAAAAMKEAITAIMEQPGGKRLK